MNFEEKFQTQLKELIFLYKKQKFKNALDRSDELLRINKSIGKSHFFNNLVGLINLSLKDFDTSISFFHKAISINKSLPDPYINLGIAYYDKGEHEISLDYFTKIYNNDKTHTISKNAIIKLLTFINPKKINNELIMINNKLQEIDLMIDCSKKINDSKINEIINYGLGLIESTLNNLDYNEDQIYRRNNVELNCERHKKIFFDFQTIPSFCFQCIKIVIHVKNTLDLIKLTLFFDKYSDLYNFDRKTMIDKKNSGYKGYIYFRDIKEANVIANKIKDKLEIFLDTKINLTIKRGCTEYYKKYPEFENVKKKLLNIDGWSRNEKDFDKQNYKDGIEKKRIKQKSLSGLTLSDFLIFNKWLGYSKSL